MLWHFSYVYDWLTLVMHGIELRNDLTHAGQKLYLWHIFPAYCMFKVSWTIRQKYSMKIIHMQLSASDFMLGFILLLIYYVLYSERKFAMRQYIMLAIDPLWCTALWTQSAHLGRVHFYHHSHFCAKFLKLHESHKNLCCQWTYIIASQLWFLMEFPEAAF